MNGPAAGTGSANLVEPADWTFPVPIAFGPGRITELGRLCRRAGSTRPLIVTDRGSAELPFIARAVDSLSALGLDSAIFAEVSPNPTDADIAVGREAFRSGDHDGVIAIGGGSGMDAGKSISLVAGNDVDLWRFDYDLGQSPELGPGGLVPLITVPTTAGTGAETESTAMVTDLARGMKGCVWHPDQKPSAAILDPELTIGLPADLTAWTGIDALVHAIEAHSVPAWHPMCDGLALEAIRLISRWLPVAVADGESLEARSGMLVGSCLAGVSFLKGLGLVHAMSHMIGAVYDTHHGLTNAVLLPPVLRFNQQAIERKSIAMAEAIDASRAFGEPSFDALYQAVVELLDQLDIPTDLGRIGVGRDRVDELAAKSAMDAAASTNPVPASVPQIADILDRALTETR
ncbi:MAG: iron-containing alcohol dehydrogenase [Acidimicrobiales bacterium]